MAYNIKYKQSVERDLKYIDKSITKRILSKIDRELPAKADKCSLLKGSFSGLKKYRIGDYRIIFSIIEQDILILRIAHRKEVYKD